MKFNFLKGPNVMGRAKKKPMTENNPDLLLSSYHFDLPEELIAQRPVDSVNRDQSKLLVYKVKEDQIIHDHFYNLSHYLPCDALVVFNRSKVFASRLIGQKLSGGKVEVFFLAHEKNAQGFFPVLIKTRGKKKLGDEFVFNKNLNVWITHIADDGTFGIDLTLPQGFNSLLDYLEQEALIPIPPYIRGGMSDEEDKKNYQTIYSKESGSVAAPTAGLHFTPKVFESLKKKGIDDAYVTLHVGLGTFKPVTVDNLADHKMHSEEFFVSKENLDKINANKKIFAVGTTSLRVLESSYGKDIKADEHYHTQIFLHPGVEVKSIEGLITNFHLPESTLLMLVSSLIGREKTLEIYKTAIENKYRFFSYGDAMLILR